MPPPSVCLSSCLAGMMDGLISLLQLYLGHGVYDVNLASKCFPRDSKTYCLLFQCVLTQANLPFCLTTFAVKLYIRKVDIS